MALLAVVVVTLVSTWSLVGARERDTLEAVEAASAAERVADGIESGLVDVVRWASGYVDDSSGSTRGALERALTDLGQSITLMQGNGVEMGPLEIDLAAMHQHVARLTEAVTERQDLDSRVTTSFDLLEGHLIELLGQPWDLSEVQVTVASRSLAALATVRGNLAAYRRLGDDARVSMMEIAMVDFSRAIAALESDGTGVINEASSLERLVDGLVAAERTIRSELDELARLEASGSAQVMNEVRPAIDGSLAERARRSQSALETARWMQILVVVVLAFVAWVGARRMRIRVVQPIADLARSAIRAASGDLRSPEDVDGPAEVLQLGQALRHLIERRRLVEAELQDSRDALAVQNERLQELDRLKSEFVASASHELRSPLTTILAYVEELELGTGGALSEDQAQFAAAIRRAAARLRLSVDDLLHLASVDAGGFRIVPSRFDLGSLIDEVCAGLEPVATRRDVGIVRPGTGSPTPVVADRDRLGQVLENLINNAVKFSPQSGRVRIAVRVTGSVVSIEVLDHGPGIESDALPYVFDRFFRAPSSAASVDGSGIGLAVVKSIVEAHGGSVEAESGVEGGARFTVHLPIAERVPEQVA